MKKTISKPWAIPMLCMLLVLGTLLTGCSSYEEDLKPVASQTEMTELDVTIPSGSTLTAIGDLLEKDGMIRSSKAFVKYCKENGLAEKLKAGDYHLNNSMGVEEIAKKIASGIADGNRIKVNIPEGYELRQIADRLEKDGLIDRATFQNEIDNGDFDYDFVKALPKGENRLEGYLFPATYEIRKDASEHEIIDMMLKKFNTVYDEKKRARTKELGKSINEIVTMASVVEREAKKTEEQPLIAGVFYNRIKDGMKLQSCATVQYVLKERKPVLRNRDLEIDSPYNTYKYAGLPPTPIASPGESAINAALYPETTDYLYFVADKDGSHVFSKTYKEHLAAQKRIYGK